MLRVFKLWLIIVSDRPTYSGQLKAEMLCKVGCKQKDSCWYGETGKVITRLRGVTMLCNVYNGVCFLNTLGPLDVTSPA